MNIKFKNLYNIIQISNSNIIINIIINKLDIKILILFGTGLNLYKIFE